MKRKKLSVSEILSKKFKTELMGYSAKEVDQFFDDIIIDFKEFLDEVDELEIKNAEINKLVNEKEAVIQRLSIEISNLKSKVRRYESKGNSSNEFIENARKNEL